jgi:hypothetical protein
MAGVYARLGPRQDRDRMRAAAWLLILIVGSGLSIALPGATILFLIAPAIALAGIALTRRSPQLGFALVIAATVIQFVMFAEFLALIETLLIDGPLWAVAPLAALASLPALVEVEAARMRPSVVLTALATLGFCIAALVVPRASAERPLGFSIDYYRDATTNKANWGIATKQAPLPAHFPGSWHKGELPYSARTRWIAAAPSLQTPVAQARVVGNEWDGMSRRVRLQLSSNGANTIAIRFPADAKVLALGLRGAAMPIPAKGEPDKALLRCTGRSCDGLQIEVVMADRRPITAELFATRFGLPSEGARLESSRPPHSQPQYSPDQTITRSTIKL